MIIRNIYHTHQVLYIGHVKIIMIFQDHYQISLKMLVEQKSKNLYQNFYSYLLIITIIQLMLLCICSLLLNFNFLNFIVIFLLNFALNVLFVWTVIVGEQLLQLRLYCMKLFFIFFTLCLLFVFCYLFELQQIFIPALFGF